MYLWGSRDTEAARHLLDMIPAISPGMIWMTGYEIEI